jgi:hypothetical protein
MLKYKVMPDQYPANPRTEQENLGTMILMHRRYTLGDIKNPSEEDFEIINDDDTISLPVYGYDHGGLVLSTGKFSCPWDSGQLGHIYMTKEKALQEGIPWDYETITKILEGEVKEYNNYLQGNCWSYEITDDDDNVIDSCSGFMADDIENSGVLDAYDKNVHALIYA